ncbi:MAG: DUF721 domain-containing protein [Candidatus Sulfotelmatobacter sp.]
MPSKTRNLRAGCPHAMPRLSLFDANFPWARATNGVFPDVKIKVLSRPCPERQEQGLQLAGSDLEKIVARSLRQAPPGQAPLMAWPVVCGSAVAERTRALSFLDGVLRVAVADAGWRSELQSLAPRYLASINRYTAEPVRRIEFVIVPENPDKGSL